MSNSFDFDQFKAQAIEQLKAGVPLSGKDGVLAPLSENLLNSALEGEMDSLQNRGVQDILIACVDGLKGFPDAIASVFPDTTVQLCIVHQIRKSIKYVASKNQKELMKDLKLVYQAVNKDAAEKALDDLETKWGEDYPIVIKSWRDNWERLSAYFQYSQHIRRIIYYWCPIKIDKA